MGVEASSRELDVEDETVVTPMHLGIGVICGALTVALIAGLALHRDPDEQRLVVINEFEDAKCVIEFTHGGHVDFQVKRTKRYNKTFASPKSGFVLMRCRATTRTLESPGHFHLVNGGLATVTLKPEGEVDVVYNAAE